MCSNKMYVRQIWPWLHIHLNNTALLHLKEEESTDMYVYMSIQGGFQSYTGHI